MAMEFISPFIGPITSCLWDPLMKQTSYLVKAKSNINNMTNSMNHLRACQDDLKKKIEDAKREQMQSTNEVELWLKEVDAIKVKADTTRTKYESRGCRLFGDCSLNCWSTYKIGKEAAMLHVEMVQLQKKRDGFNSVATKQPPGHARAIPTESTLLGLDRYVEMVRNYLIDDNIGVIGIYGMGGVGKTTLFKKIHNSLLGEDKLGFEYLIWVVVSKEFQLTTVQAKVAKNLDLKLNDKNDANQNAIDIFNYLKDKNFLLMLDDIWKGFNIVDVGIPDTHCSNDSNNQTQRRQKVILTTRFEKVCGSMHADEIIKVECLDKQNARNLFKKTLGERHLEANPGIHHLVEEVADECAGLPLALVAIARAMSTRKTIQEWQHAIVSLKRSPEDELLGEDLQMYPTLKFSYDSLNNEALRKCFLLCSLWPEDADISKDEIIASCIGIELIKDFATITEAFDEGHVLIEVLKGACLLESGSVDQLEVKMHDVMRDLAIWIASDCGVNKNKWLVKAGVGLREVKSEVGKWKEAQAVSLWCDNVIEFPPVPFECPNISFLMLQGNQYLYDSRNLRKIDPSIFQNMRALTILSLRDTYLEELPESIGMLTMLRYLDLGNTKVRSLPKGLGNLTRLRYLDLHGAEGLEYIPAGLISRLVELQVLDLFGGKAVEGISMEVEENDGEEIEEISSKRRRSLIDEVEHLPAGLKGFGVDLRSADAFKQLSNASHEFTWRLGLKEIEDLSSIQLKHNMWSHLEDLWLDHCRKAMELVFVADEGKINDTWCPIKSLVINDMRELTEIIFPARVVPSVFFQRLRDVTIRGCGGLKNINWILGLQSLAKLTLINCEGIECLVDEFPGKEDADDALDYFPSLKYLYLENLRDLRCICGPTPLINFPNLEQLRVRGCPNLKKFPFPTTSNDDKLKEIECDREWWDGLEVEESIKISLEPRRRFEEHQLDSRITINCLLGLERILLWYGVYDR